MKNTPKTLICGHKNPDVDTISAAIAYADFLNQSKGINAEAIMCDNIPQRIKWMLEEFKLAAPRLVKDIKTESNSTELILVDHNNPSEAILNLDKANLVEILDHHKLVGKITTEEPITVTIRPVGSTCTLITEFYKSAKITPSKTIANCLLAGIVTDTLNLRGPTTTENDVAALAWICEHTDLDPAQFINDYYASFSLLSSGTAEEVIKTDQKAYEELGVRYAISQVEESCLEKLTERKDELEAVLISKNQKYDYDVSLLVATNINTFESRIIVAGNPEIVSKLPFTKISPSIYSKQGFVSRKKQMIPVVIEAIKSFKYAEESVVH